MDPTVGSGNHSVSQGECMTSIAVDAGHFWKKLWELGENRELREKRKDPNALLPGDQVEVPPIEEKEESRGCNARHGFRRLGVPSKIKVRCLFFGEPLANCAYRLDIDGVLREGDTDDQGIVEAAIPPQAETGRLFVTDEDGDEHEIPFSIGGLDPLDTISGTKGRLDNLGYSCGTIDGEDNDEFQAALKRFQEDQGLEISGDPDEATRERLKELGG